MWTSGIGSNFLFEVNNESPNWRLKVIIVICRKKVIFLGREKFRPRTKLTRTIFRDKKHFCTWIRSILSDRTDTAGHMRNYFQVYCACVNCKYGFDFPLFAVWQKINIPAFETSAQQYFPREREKNQKGFCNIFSNCLPFEKS